jgi:hypothetical protein
LRPFSLPEERPSFGSSFFRSRPLSAAASVWLAAGFSSLICSFSTGAAGGASVGGEVFVAVASSGSFGAIAAATAQPRVAK